MNKNHISYITKWFSIILLFIMLIAIHEYFSIEIEKELKTSFSPMTYLASYSLTVCLYSIFGVFLYLIPNISNYKNCKLRLDYKKFILLSFPILTLLLLIGPGRYFYIFFFISRLSGKFMMALTSEFSSIILSVTLGYIVALCIEGISKEELEV